MSLGPKAIACLEIAELDMLAPERRTRFWDAAEQFSEKAVRVKMEELADRGYLEYGVAAVYSWLTEKGTAALAESRVPA